MALHARTQGSKRSGLWEVLAFTTEGTQIIASDLTLESAAEIVWRNAMDAK